jgi:hypothetical protein
MWWLLVLGLAGLAACSSGVRTTSRTCPPERIAVSSPAFAAGVAIPAVHLRRRESLPPLGWSGVPTGTVEVALVVDDPDAPGTYVHWVVVSIGRTAPSWPRARCRRGRGATAPARPPTPAPVRPAPTPPLPVHRVCPSAQGRIAQRRQPRGSDPRQSRRRRRPWPAGRHVSAMSGIVSRWPTLGWTLRLRPGRHSCWSAGPLPARNRRRLRALIHLGPRAHAGPSSSGQRRRIVDHRADDGTGGKVRVVVATNTSDAALRPEGGRSDPSRWCVPARGWLEECHHGGVLLSPGARHRCL